MLTSYIEKINNELNLLLQQFDSFLDVVEIVHPPIRPENNHITMIIQGKWECKDKTKQTELNKNYKTLFEKITLLLNSALETQKKEINIAHRKIVDVIELQGTVCWLLKKDAIRAEFDKKISTYSNFIKILSDEKKHELLVVPDTNALIIERNPEKYEEFCGSKKFTFLLLPTVLSELDKLKNDKNNEFAAKVKSVINIIQGYRNQGKITEGIIIHKTIIVRAVAIEPNFDYLPRCLDKTNSDDRIIASILNIQIINPNSKVLFVSNDTNALNKSEFYNIDHYYIKNKSQT